MSGHLIRSCFYQLIDDFILFDFSHISYVQPVVEGWALCWGVSSFLACRSFSVREFLHVIIVFTACYYPWYPFGSTGNNDVHSPPHNKVSLTFPRTFHFYLLSYFLPPSLSLLPTVICFQKDPMKAEIYWTSQPELQKDEIVNSRST
jgi:hypothetical protein